jgi:Uma2 family endonuclease
MLHMDSVLERPWTTEAFLAWEDRQEGKYEFDGREVIPMTGGTLAHQAIVFNLQLLLRSMTAGTALRVVHEMRLRIGARVRYPDITVFAGPLEQSTRTLVDALAIFEVLSDDTATTDRVTKLLEYTDVPSLRAYVLLEQTAMAATLFQREPGGSWVATAHTSGDLRLPGIDAILPLADLYEGLSFPA